MSRRNIHTIYHVTVATLCMHMNIFSSLWGSFQKIVALATLPVRVRVRKDGVQMFEDWLLVRIGIFVELVILSMKRLLVGMCWVFYLITKVVTKKQEMRMGVKPLHMGKLLCIYFPSFIFYWLIVLHQQSFLPDPYQILLFLNMAVSSRETFMLSSQRYTQGRCCVYFLMNNFLLILLYFYVKKEGPSKHPLTPIIWEIILVVYWDQTTILPCLTLTIITGYQ